jgi:hypothetical protein
LAEGKSEVTFFGKKVTKKTSAPVGVGAFFAKARRTKSFLVTFFQKSNFFLPL